MIPICVFPINLNEELIITPVDKIVLFFSTSPCEIASPIDITPEPAIEIDLTGVNSRTVVFDQNGWLDNKEPWTKQIRAGASLAPYLITG